MSTFEIDSLYRWIRRLARRVDALETAQSNRVRSVNPLSEDEMRAAGPLLTGPSVLDRLAEIFEQAREVAAINRETVEQLREASARLEALERQVSKSGRRLADGLNKSAARARSSEGDGARGSSARGPSAAVDDDHGDVANEQVMRLAAVPEDLYPAVRHLIDAFTEGCDVVVLTEPDLVSAVQKLLGHSDSSSQTSGAPEATQPEPPTSGECGCR